MRNPAIHVRMPKALYDVAVAYASETQRTPSNLLQHALCDLLSKRGKWSLKTQGRAFPGAGKGRET